MKRVKHKNDMGGTGDSKTESGSVVPGVFEDKKKEKKKRYLEEPSPKRAVVI